MRNVSQWLRPFWRALSGSVRAALESLQPAVCCLLPAVVLVWIFVGEPTSAGAQGASEVVFDLRIVQGRLAGNRRVIRVKQNDAVKLRWTSDRPIVVHLHGYDFETKVVPGETAEMAFVARATGRFPVEEHKPTAQGGHSHGEVALVQVEVHPR
jgi:hypothetical protein